MTDLPADVRERYRDLARQRNWPAGTESAFLETARWFRDLDEGPAPRSYYEGAADEPGGWRVPGGYGRQPSWPARSSP
jgi:hypothetical protein